MNKVQTYQSMDEPPDIRSSLLSDQSKNQSQNQTSMSNPSNQFHPPTGLRPSTTTYTSLYQGDEMGENIGEEEEKKVFVDESENMEFRPSDQLFTPKNMYLKRWMR